MKLHTVGSGLLVFASMAAWGQTSGGPLAFDVVSVKPAERQPDGMIMRRLTGGPGSTDPGTLTCNNVTLKMLVTLAYNLKNFQVEGPDWIESTGHDIIAKMPAGTTREQMAQMLQTLLKERFQVEFHRETKQLPVFALVVAKGGPKMKTVEVPAVPDGLPPMPTAGSGMMRGAGDGPPKLTSGPGIRMAITDQGRQMAGYMTMAQLANQLNRQVDRPVLDETELTGTYDVDITWMPDDFASLGPAHGGGRGGPGTDTGGGAPTTREPAPNLMQAMQDRLGLKLEPKKSSAEILIIDRANKSPVEN